MSDGEPAFAPPAKRPSQDGTALRSLSRRDRLFRIIILATVIASVALILWSLFGLLFPRLKQARILSASVGALSADVDRLENEWTEAQAAQVRNRRRQVEFELFGGRAALESWLAHLKEEGVPLALSVRGDFGAVNTRMAGGHLLTIVPVMMTAEVQPASPDTATPSPYQRILQFSQLLTGGQKRADLTDLTVMAGSNSVSRAVLLMNYWVDEQAKP